MSPNPSDPIGAIAATIRVRGTEPTDVPLLDLTSFLYDFNLLYELGRLATDPAYLDVPLDLSRIWYRDGRPLLEEDRLRVARLRKESPLELLTIITATGGAAGAIWVVVQAIEKIANLRLNREKLQLEVEKLRREKEREERDANIREQSVEVMLVQRQVRHQIDRVTQRLAQSAVKVTELEVYVARRAYVEKHGEDG